MEKLIVGRRYKIDPVVTAEFVETRKKEFGHTDVAYFKSLQPSKGTGYHPDVNGLYPFYVTEDSTYEKA